MEPWTRYVVRLRHRYRDEHPDCRGAVAGTPGVRVMQADNSNTIVIETTPEIAAGLKRQLGDHFIVEPEIRYYPLDQTFARR